MKSERKPKANPLEKLLGLVPGQYTPADAYARIESLLRSEQAETRLRRQLDIYKLALGLKTSATPLSDIAAYLDTHTGKGDVSTVQVRNVAALCRELEANASREA